MKKYKLIKEYPGYSNLGKIVEICSTDETGYYSENTEYWEELIEKDFEILRYYSLENHTTGRTTSNVKINDTYKIHSVKRLSDGEVFTIGDTVSIKLGSSNKRLDKIKLNDDSSAFLNGIWFSYSSGCSHFKHAIKAQQPLFLTHDGKDIFEGDEVYYVSKLTKYQGSFTAAHWITFRSELNAYFLTKEEAQFYVIVNEKVLSIEDFWEFVAKPGSNIVKQKQLKRLVKERLDLK